MVDREVSEFNYALKYLDRINFLFYKTAICSMDLNAHGWFHALIALFRELSTHMKPEEIKWFNTEKSKINKLLSQIRSPIAGIQPDLYDKLHDFEMKLRKIMKDAGLEGKSTDDPSMALR